VKFDLLYCDPPWRYNSRTNHKTRFRGGACGHYDLMTTDEIKQLPVESITKDDAVLFMWATFPMLTDALEVIDAWGFTYKTNGFTWMKQNTSGNGLFFGVGYYTKSNAEVCLLATKGKTLKPESNSVSSAILAPRREHSRKPDETYERIEKLYPSLSKVELFSRNERDGWYSLGNGIDGRDIRESIIELAERNN
jgi:N6-adenosine-specific RNA methylase IME4